MKKLLKIMDYIILYLLVVMFFRDELEQFGSDAILKAILTAYFIIKISNFISSTTNKLLENSNLKKELQLVKTEQELLKNKPVL